MGAVCTLRCENSCLPSKLDIFVGENFVPKKNLWKYFGYWQSAQFCQKSVFDRPRLTIDRVIALIFFKQKNYTIRLHSGAVKFFSDPNHLKHSRWQEASGNVTYSWHSKYAPEINDHSIGQKFNSDQDRMNNILYLFIINNFAIVLRA